MLRFGYIRTCERQIIKYIAYTYKKVPNSIKNKYCQLYMYTVICVHIFYIYQIFFAMFLVKFIKIIKTFLVTLHPFRYFIDVGIFFQYFTISLK